MKQKISELELNNINPKNLKIQIGDEDSTWLPSNYFDVVFVFNLLHEIDNKPNFIQELERILKPNGIIFLVEHDVINEELKIIKNKTKTFYIQVLVPFQDLQQMEQLFTTDLVTKQAKQLRVIIYIF